MVSSRNYLQLNLVCMPSVLSPCYVINIQIFGEEYMLWRHSYNLLYSVTSPVSEILTPFPQAPSVCALSFG